MDNTLVPLKFGELAGIKVFVYWNLHKKCWSVKALRGRFKGKVIGHTQTLQLHACEFKVSEAGRQRVLKEQRKNVHAGVVGYVITDVVKYLDQAVKLTCEGENDTVSYNPYLFPCFYRKGSGKFVHAAFLVQMCVNKQVTALGVVA